MKFRFHPDADAEFLAPYGVVYALREEGLLVLPVMHLRRSPEYWRERL
jgi:hypothetical protein